MVTQFDILTNPGLYNDYEHTIDFESLSIQTNFWNDKIIKSFGQSKLNFLNDKTVRFNENYNTANTWSYCRALVVNGTQSKWHYYFINNISIRGALEEEEQVVELELEEDVMQTYMFDYEIKESFVEREHQDRMLPDGTRLFSRTQENLVCPASKPLYLTDTPKQNILNIENFMYAVVEATTNKQPQESYGVNPSSTFVIPFLKFPNTGNAGAKIVIGVNNYDAPSLKEFVSIVTEIPFIISVQFVKNLTGISSVLVDNSMNPLGVVFSPTEWGIMHVTFKDKNETEHTWYGISPLKYNITTFNSSINSNIYNTTLPNINEAASYVNESKLFSSPFTTAELHFMGEMKEFDIAEMRSFDLNYIQSISGMVHHYICPKTYTPISLIGSENNLSYYLASPNKNSLPLRNDAWTNYLYNNSNQAENSKIIAKTQIATSAINAGISAALAPFTGGLSAIASLHHTEAIVSSVQNYQQILAKEQDIKNTPDTIKEIGNDILFNGDTKQDKAVWFIYQIDGEFLKIAWKYMQHYGYACNEYKIPSIKSRYYYNYIKMRCSLNANLNTNLINRIKTIFDNGITFWHYRDANTFLFNDYSKENVEMNLIGETQNG